MARQRVVSYVYVCDVCGSEITRAAPSREITWLGGAHPVDLCAAHQRELDRVLSELKVFVDAARPVRRPAGSVRGVRPSLPAASVARPWAPPDGRCRKAPPELFFVSPGDDPAPAKAVCARCPVLAGCRQHALGIPGLAGIWAGMTEGERDQERSRVACDPPSWARPVAPTAAGRSRAASPGSLSRVLQELTATPNRWASVAHWEGGRVAGMVATKLRTGRLPVPGGGTWEFEGRSSDEGGSDLYAHFTSA